MIVTVIGKRIVNRESYKTGKYVNGCVVYAKYFEDGVEGVAAKSYWISNECCDKQGIVVGRKYLLKENGHIVVGFKPIVDRQHPKLNLLKDLMTIFKAFKA